MSRMVRGNLYVAAEAINIVGARDRMNIVAAGHDAVLLLPGSRNEGWQERRQARLPAKRTVHAFSLKRKWLGKRRGGTELYKQVRMKYRQGKRIP